MRKLFLISAVALFSTMLSGCSSDDEPQSVVDTRIGLSAESVFVGNDMGDSEVISVQTDGWKLSYVTFSDSHNAYVCNLSSSAPFAFQKEWLSI